MSIGVEALFTSALGLQPPWVVEDVKLDVPTKRIDFEVSCSGALLSCPVCSTASQPVHDRLRRSWRHLDFFQFEAWLHADVPRVACGRCGKTTQLALPWARPGSGFTAAFEALALALCRELPVRQAAELLRCKDKQLRRRIEFYVDQARAQESFKGVQIVGIDETSRAVASTTSPSCRTWMPSGCCLPPRAVTTRRCWTSSQTSRPTVAIQPTCAMCAWT